MLNFYCDSIEAFQKINPFTVYGNRSMGFIGFYYASMKVNSLDLSPNYAGSLIAFVNELGALTGIVAPTFVGLMTPDVKKITVHLNSYLVTAKVFKLSVVIGTVEARFFHNIWRCHVWHDSLFNLGLSRDAAIQQSENFIPK